MILTLKRYKFTDTCTLGKLYINGNFFAHTLEDVYRGEIYANPSLKVKGKTAIDFGRYKVTVTMSNRFKKELPLLHDVPQFEGVRFHGGNTHEDTEGCVLVAAQTDGIGKVWDCKEKMIELTKLIKDQPLCFLDVERESLA